MLSLREAAAAAGLPRVRFQIDGADGAALAAAAAAGFLPVGIAAQSQRISVSFAASEEKPTSRARSTAYIIQRGKSRV